MQLIQEHKHLLEKLLDIPEDHGRKVIIFKDWVKKHRGIEK